MKTPVKWVKDCLKDAYLDKYMEGSFGDEASYGGPVPKRHTVFWYLCWHMFGRYAPELVCKIRGHDWDVDSDVGPESGSEYFNCKRCGVSHHIIYY